ncbi:hypothetical protein GYMLUDRAFT_1023851 [Collybiopsis luxurians FD-317 M1]|nr:hypothetical protein GYMLUDRAFT_1023851 [Collybiopsis luxurians FD-317 M1]
MLSSPCVKSCSPQYIPIAHQVISLPQEHARKSADAGVISRLFNNDIGILNSQLSEMQWALNIRCEESQELGEFYTSTPAKNVKDKQVHSGSRSPLLIKHENCCPLFISPSSNTDDIPALDDAPNEDPIMASSSGFTNSLAHPLTAAWANVINKTYIYWLVIPATLSSISSPEPPTHDVKYEAQPATPATCSTIPNKPPPLCIKLEVEQSSPVSQPPNYLCSTLSVSHSNDNNNSKYNESNEPTLVNSTPNGLSSNDCATVRGLTMLVTAGEKMIIKAICSYINERLALHCLETALQDLYIDILCTCLITADLCVLEPPILKSQQQFLHPKFIPHK